MRIALVSVAAGTKFQELAKVVNPAKQAYCRRFGYDFVHFDRPLDPHRPLPWSKIPAVLQVLPQYDWVLWHDTDTALWNSYSIREFIALCGNAFMLLQGDGLGLNSGVFLIRNTPQAHHFLAEAWRRTDLIHASVWEQAAIAELYAVPHWRQGIRYFDPGETTFNLQRCFFGAQNNGWNSLFLHLAGFHDHRAARLANLVQLAALPSDDRLHRALELGSFLNQRLQTGRGAVVSIADAQRAQAIMNTWDGWQLDVVDPWLPTRFADRRLRVHAATSGQSLRDIPDLGLDFVCVEGAHTARGYLAELKSWLPKVRAGGVISGRCLRPAMHAPSCCPGANGCRDQSASADQRSIPAEVRQWCAEQNLALGVTTDWPDPIWYVPHWPGIRKTGSASGGAKGFRQARVGSALHTLHKPG